jgi:hypothetical protein
MVEVYAVGENICFDGQGVYFISCNFVEVCAEFFFGVEYGEVHL